MIENARPSPVGTRGGVEWMRGPGACPRWGVTCLLHAVPTWIALPPGQAQGPHPAPHLPLVPTGRVTHITQFGRQNSSGRFGESYSMGSASYQFLPTLTSTLIGTSRAYTPSINLFTRAFAAP